MVNDLLVGLITGIICGLLILFTITDLMWYKRAFNPYREFVWRILVPILVCAIYQVPYFVTGYNLLALLILPYLLFNVLLAMVLWNTEAFFSGILKLPSAGRKSYRFWGYFSRDMGGTANYYKMPHHSFSLSQIFQVIEDNNLLDRDPKQKFKSTKEEKSFKRFVDDYTMTKKEVMKDPSKFHVTTFGYYERTQLLRGYKRVVLVHEYVSTIESDVLTGNYAPLPEKIKIEKRQFETYIVFAGLKQREISQRLEVSNRFLDIFATMPLLEKIPILQSENKKLRAILVDQAQALETHRSLEKTSQLAIHGKPKQPAGAFDMKGFVRSFAYLILALIGVVIVFIALMCFGVI